MSSVDRLTLQLPGADGLLDSERLLRDRLAGAAAGLALTPDDTIALAAALNTLGNMRRRALERLLDEVLGDTRLLP